MYIVGDIYVSDEIAEECFICDLEKCKGACCVEGELGAPLKKEELSILEGEKNNIRPYLSEEGKAELDRQGLFVLDPDGEYSTPTIGGKECAYAIYEEDGKLACGIEKAWKDGKSNFRKPVSCHLYPIREVQYPKFLALNYHKWGICAPACELGKKMNQPLYFFLKEALIRRFGEAWFEDLKSQIKERENKK
ncbi:DUF3109 family protein [Hyphobacterium sp. CCMP332]|nr:DUF3109 family protein [Hyphobacterium sp. CCMP332]